MNQDNDSNWQAKRLERTIRDLNIGANGRGFIFCLVAIALVAGDLRGALVISLVLGASVIVEQLPNPHRWYAALVVYFAVALWTVVLMVLLS